MSLLALNRTGVKLIHHFTRDRKELLVALNSVQRSQQPVTEGTFRSPLYRLALTGCRRSWRSFGNFRWAASRRRCHSDRRRVITITLDGF